MATFTNFATLSYSGGTTNSNTVVGELLETLSAAKVAVTNDYSARDNVTYIISLINSGTAALTGLTVTDDLGSYLFDSETVYPLRYVTGSVRYYVNGVLQTAPAVVAGPPMVISGISVPAGGNVMLIYEAEVTAYAPLASGAEITNEAAISGGGLSTPVTATETVSVRNRAELTVSKAISPAAVAENGQLTYTFVIENSGNSAAAAEDNVVLRDVFDPILENIAVTYNGTLWTEEVDYTYDRATGEFVTLPGQIVVPAAEYMQNSDGTWTVSPGTVSLSITGTV